MIENRHTRVDYLLETTGFDQGDLLHEIIRAMSDQEFDDIYQFICRMHDIEPDEDKFTQSSDIYEAENPDGEWDHVKGSLTE
tara:strand:- start:299 stop:544 length:246 start_codon:yes stop_codon:yes gene_type:complete